MNTVMVTILQPIAADRLDRLVQRMEDFARLAVEVGVWRSGLAGEPDGLAAFGDDGARDGALLCTRIGRITFFGVGGRCPGAKGEGGRNDGQVSNASGGDDTVLRVVALGVAQNHVRKPDGGGLLRCIRHKSTSRPTP